MLGQPRHGWTHVSVGDFEAPASYLTDVPMEILDALICGFQYGIDPAVTFDAEGYVYTIIASSYYGRVYVILERDEEPALFSVDMSIDAFTKEILCDIEDNLEYWAMFTFDDDDGVVTNRTKELQEKIQTLKKLIQDSSQ